MIASKSEAAKIPALREAGIVAAGAFALTAEGRELLAALEPLEGWAQRWARRG